MDVNLSGRLQLVKYSISIELYINSKKKKWQREKKEKNYMQTKNKTKNKKTENFIDVKNYSKKNKTFFL